MVGQPQPDHIDVPAHDPRCARRCALSVALVLLLLDRMAQPSRAGDGASVLENGFPEAAIGLWWLYFEIDHRHGGFLEDRMTGSSQVRSIMPRNSWLTRKDL